MSEFWRRAKGRVWHEFERDDYGLAVSLCGKHCFDPDTYKYQPWSGDDSPKEMCKECVAVRYGA